MRSCLVQAAVSLVLVACCAVAVSAQSAGIVRGRVTDASGASIVGASVTLENTTDKYRQTVSSDGEGRYTFFNVPFNSYTLIGTQVGFTNARDEVALRTSLPVERDITLAVAVSGGQANEPTPISDNSFLIEEAYNQEAGVIQHISTFQRDRNGDFGFTFTQEIPIPSQRHQFSYTLPAFRAGDPDGGRGLGDVLLNYRFQIVDNDRIAIAPRATVVLPTGDEAEESGTGGAGFQFNIPVSTKLSRRFVAHTNAGATFTPRARNVVGERAATQDYLFGQSLVWLARPRFNVLLEAVYEGTESVISKDATERDNAFTLNPGVRWAYNFRNGLQIVPGISIPIGVGPSRGERGVFFYLSFEHPFKKQSR